MVFGTDRELLYRYKNPHNAKQYAPKRSAYGSQRTFSISLGILGMWLWGRCLEYGWHFVGDVVNITLAASASLEISVNQPGAISKIKVGFNRSPTPSVFFHFSTLMGDCSSIFTMKVVCNGSPSTRSVSCHSRTL